MSHQKPRDDNGTTRPPPFWWPFITRAGGGGINTPRGNDRQGARRKLFFAETFFTKKKHLNFFSQFFFHKKLSGNFFFHDLCSIFFSRLSGKIDLKINFEKKVSAVSAVSAFIECRPFLKKILNVLSVRNFRLSALSATQWVAAPLINIPSWNFCGGVVKGAYIIHDWWCPGRWI